MMIFIILNFYKMMIIIKYLRSSANNDFTQIIIIKDVCHVSYHDSYHNKWARSLIRFKSC